MASENTANRGAGLEHQDQSIKDRKSQLFEGPKPESDEVVAARKTFTQHVHQTPAAPLSTGVKASLWAVGVLVALLFLAAILGGGGRKPRGRHNSALPSDRPAAVAWRIATTGGGWPGFGTPNPGAPARGPG